MVSLLENFYARWRAQGRTAIYLHEENSFPSERLLQAIWQHQRLKRDALQTSTGKIVRVFHPGFASVEGGPDFRSAVLQIGNDAPRSGDVEIDLRANGWRAHGHDRNPNFKSVILHVVWEMFGVPPSGGDPAKGRLKAELQTSQPPILSLHNCLDAPLVELSLSLENESLRSLPENLRGKCCAPLRELDETQMTGLLREAAKVRFHFKAQQFRARAKNAGWEQALWENLFRALGYKHNIWQMQSLAETKSGWSHGTNSAFELQARLFGISGLLPDELTRAQKSSDNYLRRVWDFWWRERDEFSNCVLPRPAWKFHGLRPANHPQRRLALASHWLADKNFISKIEGWSAEHSFGKRTCPRVPCSASRRTHVPEATLAGAAGTAALPETNFFAANLHRSLREILEAHDEFWSWHWTFKSALLPKPQPLLGDARVTDLAVNVILPWLWVRAVEGGNEKIQSEMEQRFFAWPAAEDNSILKLARQRLLGTSNARILKTAAAQQGLLQIVRDFCGHSNAVCDDCRFPELVHGWAAKM